MKSIKIPALKFQLGCFLAVFVFTLSCSPKIMQKERGQAGSDPSEKNSMLLRIISYNIHHCNPPSRPDIIDVDAIVNVIKQQSPDIVALQEVDVNTGRSGKVHQAAEIAHKLNMSYFFGKAIDHDGGAYGVAILSKYPLTETTVHRLPTKAGSGGEPRVLATAKVRLPNNRFIRFGATHLDAQSKPENRRLQISEINSITLRENLPFVLAGDFNASHETEEIGKLDSLFTRTCSSCAFTFPEKTPNTVIDYIAFRPRHKFNVVHQQVIAESYASDHRPVVALLRLADGQGKDYEK